jgi:hypothetical protein
MTRPEFEHALALLRERIRALPEPQRTELERLAEETLARHEDITRTSLQARGALEHLELSFERLRGACERLAQRAGDAREALARASRRSAVPSPGMN